MFPLGISTEQPQQVGLMICGAHISTVSMLGKETDNSALWTVCWVLLDQD